jgi:indolepyruvate ferredoxin oxidoreductase
LGDSLYTNPLLMGFAWQKGWLPLEKYALIRAIELNNVAIENNKIAFEWGCRAAVNLAEVQALCKPAQVITFHKKDSLEQMVAKRVEFLSAYQDSAYAMRYSAFVDRVKAAEATLGSTQLTEAVARYLFKLMAIKDEYEVARLHTDKRFHDKIAAQFEGDYKLAFHLAPPLIAKANEKGELIKQRFGPWMKHGFAFLAKLKGLRGGAFDIFGKTEERRMERQLLADYEAQISEAIAKLSADNHATVIELARIPEDIRGYGHVKERHVKAVAPKRDAILAKLRSGVVAATKATKATKAA